MSKTKKEVMTDPLLRKGAIHATYEEVEKLCPDCGGLGIDSHGMECTFCQGTGTYFTTERSKIK